MSKTLREQLIGAWMLISCVEEPEDGSAPSHPTGEDPVGIILYTSDGYMAAQLMRRNRRTFSGSAQESDEGRILSGFPKVAC